MDFDLSEEQEAIRDLARQVFDSATSPESVGRIEQSDDRFDRDLWAALADTGLLGVAVPEAHGGLGFGAIELALVLEAHGRSVAPIPLLPTAVAAHTLAAFGSAEQQAAWLPGVAAGSVVLSLALEGWGASDPHVSPVPASPADDGWILSGSKPGVAATADAARVLVPIAVGDGNDGNDGVTIAIVDPRHPAVVLEVGETTDHQLQATMRLDDVPTAASDTFGDGDVLAWAVAQHRVATAATVLGACEQAVAITVEHANHREQFGRPLAMNQSYSQRLADAAIDIDCIRATVTQAAWRLDAGRDATEEVLIAAWWASEAGSRVVHSTQHLHGGTGADVSYPVHRYYLAVKQLANSLGTASSHLAALGAEIAAHA